MGAIPGLVKVSPIEAHHRRQGPGMYTGMCTSPIAADTDDGGWQSGVPAIEGLRASYATTRAPSGSSQTRSSTCCPTTSS